MCIKTLLAATLVAIWPYYDYGNSPAYDRGISVDEHLFIDAFGTSWEKGAISDLPQTLTGISATLIARYESKNADATNLDPIVGNTLTATGSGGVFDLATPYGPLDKAYDGEGTLYYVDGGTTFGNVGTNDIVIEFVGYLQNTTDHGLVAKRINSGGLEGYALMYNGLLGRFEFLIDNGTTLVSTNATVSADQWVHVLVFANRDGNASIYVNNVFTANKTISTSAGDLDAAVAFNVGAGRAGTGIAHTHIAYVAVWTSTDIGSHVQTDLVAERYEILTGAN